jgi:hypothetical protein
VGRLKLPDSLSLIGFDGFTSPSTPSLADSDPWGDTYAMAAC